MLEVLCTQGSFMRIGGKQLYTALVKERFLKLDSSHIEYVLDCLRESTADIRNIKAYLLEMLFNAPATCGSYYRAKVNHDFHDSGYLHLPAKSLPSMKTAPLDKTSRSAVIVPRVPLRQSSDSPPGKNRQ